jgi:hypothetical protein
MNTNLELKTGYWLLLVGSHSTRITVLKIISRLADVGPVRIIDGGLMYDPYIVLAGMDRGMKKMDRIKVYNAFDCREMLAALESLESGPASFVVLDFLRTFSNLFEGFEQRKSLLRLCLDQLNRLQKESSGLVSVHLPAVLSQTETELLELVTRACAGTYHVDRTVETLIPVRVY